METSNRIGTQTVVNHHRQMPYHLPRCDETPSVREEGAGNLLAQGDDLLSFDALEHEMGQMRAQR